MTTSSPEKAPSTPLGKLRIYCCGGTGLNVGSEIISQLKNHHTHGLAEIQLTFVDTSTSNLPKDATADSLYLLKGMDGSGKLRSENHVKIGENAKAILERHVPGDMNIVISSLAGGSGSVIAPTLVKQLLDQDKVVISFGVASQDSLIEINNSIKTLKSYEAVSKMTNKPVVLYTESNANSTEHEKLNQAFAAAVLMLALLASRQNEGLDTADLKNWVNYHRVTTAPIKAVSLSIFNNTKPSHGEDHLALTVATLAKRGQDTSTEFLPDYQTVGYLPAIANENIQIKDPFHFVISDGILSELYKSFDERLQAMERKRQARNYIEPMMGESDSATDSGLVL